MKKTLQISFLSLLIFFFWQNAANAQTCQANFSTAISGCTANFTDASIFAPPPINVFYFWDLGDGTTANTQNVSHTYGQNGAYAVCLTVTTFPLCSSQFCDTIFITNCQGANCQARFTFNDILCPQVSFTDNSIGSPTTWNWNFGDGSSSALQSPSHTYGTNGNFNVCLTISSPLGCQSTICDTISINCIQPPACQAMFRMDTSTCPNIQFTDLSTASPGIISSWGWDFGDGTGSSLPNPGHIYSTNGTYNICLNITTTNGCQSTICSTLVISCNAPPTCTSEFSSVLTACPRVQFTDQSQVPPGVLISYNWSFGDGTFSTAQNPQHTYTQNGTFIVCLTIFDQPGTCQSTDCDTIVINCIQQPLCNANFRFADSLCPNIFFTNLSQTPPGVQMSYNWSFGDGATSTAQNPSHTYGANGNYTVCLTISEVQGNCQDVFCDTISINCYGVPTCQGNYRWAFGPNGCPSVQFTDLSTANGTITSWIWDFGDGIFSPQQNPSHSYAANGNFITCLTITTNNNCTNRYCDTVSINCIGGPTCQANFNWAFSANGCPTVQFTDLSTASGTITSWAWTFGDGNSSTVKNPVHTYSANGNYNVCLVITTNDNCTNTICSTVAINCIQPPCQSNFRWSDSLCPNIIFTNTSTYQPGQLVTWQWQFGDGSTSNLENPSHIYQQNGTYSVCLTLTTGGGCTSTFCDTLTINCIGAPTCQGNYSWAFGALGCPGVQFTDLSTSNGTITSWIWNFGDGASSTLQNPTHSYTTNGNFIACVTITTNNNCSNRYCDTVSINCIGGPTCQADFSWGFPLNSCPRAQFTDLSTASGTITSWAWTFGDGGSSNLQNPVHSYAANGSYNACLVITTNNNCTSTFCNTVVINCIQPQCQADFRWSDSLCPNIVFTNTSTYQPGQLVTWQWQFGDGSTSSQEHPAHVYAQNGNYVVCLTLTTGGGCTSTHCDTISINCIANPVCQGNYSWAFGPNACPQVQFTDLSTASGTITSWIWNFGDGASSTLQNPNHVYTTNGNFLACVTITTNDGCSNRYCDTVTINCIGGPTCQANFSSAFTPNGCPAVQFTDLSTASGGTITSWAWTFGDGTSSTQQDPSHVYAANGNYNACLTITTNNNCTNSFCNIVVINCIQTQCQADFRWSDSLCPNIVFTNTSTYQPGQLVTWQWQFGDGSTSSLENPNHTYLQNGSYVVCLTLTTGGGCTSTDCDTISINCIGGPTCQGNYSWAFGPNACPQVQFTDLSTASGTITSWIWNFGDGASSTLQNPNHVYTTNGDFLACVTITTSDSCSNRYCDTVRINCIGAPTCQGDYSWAFGPNACPQVQFTDQSTASGTITSWIWNFGDGGTSTLQNPNHVYATNGNFLSCVTITTNDSCSSRFCDTVRIQCIQPPQCNADFNWRDSLCPQIQFLDLSPGVITTWAWDFGDGNTANTQNPFHTYILNGTYQVCLTIVDSAGCSDSLCNPLTISCITAIDEGYAASIALDLWPNPAENEVHIDFNLSREAEFSLEVFSLNGQSLFSKGPGILIPGPANLTLETAGLADGLYMLRLQFGDQVIHRNLMIRH